jgi:hypothetical protein
MLMVVWGCHDLKCSPIIEWVIKSRRVRWAGNVARMGLGRGVYRVLAEKREGERPLGIHRLRWEDNIKMELQDVGCSLWSELRWLRIERGGGNL